VLVVAALPLARATLVQPGNQSVPEGRDARTVTNTIDAEFTPNIDSPISARLSEAAVDEARAEIARLDGVRAVSRPQPLGDGTALVQATPVDEPLSGAAQDTARSIRAIADRGEADGGVGGPTAEFIDFKKSLLDHVPLVAALIATSTMILLFLLTGSVILPIKTLVMNLLSIVAAFGLTVVVFQDGFGADLFAYEGPEAIETALLVVVGATTFGLATDYAVLVLARIKEYHDEGKDNETAVALGIERTGRVITAAALLLAVVFLAFTSSEIFFMKEVGFAQAVAVLIDASIVRALLVPALMRLFGQWNWWAPRPLRRLHARLGLAEPGYRAATNEMLSTS
jgi:RND superfamily putative drug exporter